ncbi:MAG: hypothetical protein Aurels2KO_30010 [Aureliella sp.]
MTKRIPKRVGASIATLLAVALTALAIRYADRTLGDPSTVSGWSLLAAVASLYLLQLRKKFVGRLGPVSVWLQVHVYTGTFACAVFLMHIGWPVRGIFEQCLAFVFVFVSATGVLLTYLSRTTPRRLAAIAEDHHLAQIPSLQNGVASDAHSLALQSTSHGEGATLAEYYQRRLLPYFRSPRGFLYCIVPNGIRRRQLLRELGGLDRYLGDSGRSSAAQLATAVKVKDDLDYQYALQYRLKLFFMLHVSLTWSLALLVAVHVVLVLRFQGTLQ